MEVNTINNEQAVRLAVSYAEYAKIRVCELETRLDVQLAISASKNLRAIQNATGVEVVGLDRHGDPKLPRMLEMLEKLLVEFA